MTTKWGEAASISYFQTAAIMIFCWLWVHGFYVEGLACSAAFVLGNFTYAFFKKD